VAKQTQFDVGSSKWHQMGFES